MKPIQDKNGEMLEGTEFFVIETDEEGNQVIKSYDELVNDLNIEGSTKDELDNLRDVNDDNVRSANVDDESAAEVGTNTSDDADKAE